ncbi:long-chain-fatty-acid--CoA ligase [Vibrio ichthyoenteri ATCC 700023]|uniref:Long-chain-fatty-acid--CoA ligase n=1 Tax=Vibrio ichthyoenteri ATCC 700023 TaxID=870968 RepID=F9S0E8_9VIBR|nr:long-chain fatty acid--CoA ligase [Vibrio ichthyoenteri]EGU43418.1 long-chain-fatty-acid--CoA ligase [Vibrio ichthyoenteri ATCC 700023]
MNQYVNDPSNYQLLIKNLLFSPVAFDPQQEIVYANHRRHSYQTFHDRVKQFANALTKMGVQKGDTVAVMDYDSHRYLECYFAIPMIGAKLHMINVRLSPEQILFTIDHAEDDILLIHEEFLPILDQIKGRIDTVNHYVVLRDNEECEYEQLLKQEDTHFNFPDFDENTVATTFYTTGTTGMPKGVFFTHRQLVLHTLGILSTIGTNAVQGRLHQGDVYMPITPMFHVHAWGLPYMATMLGVKQVYPGKYIPDSLLALIAQEKVTFSHCVPTILHLLLSSPKSETVDFSQWKVVIGGAALPKALCKSALERGIDVFAGYGMSETGPILSIVQLNEEYLKLDIDQQAEYRSKTGKKVAMVEAHIVDEEMCQLEHDGEVSGEIVIRAPWLTPNYYKDNKNSKALWRGGYLHTGDVATIDGEGFIKITDRVKDMIKISGEWVSSLELEDIIHQHRAVSEVAVIGMSHNKWGEVPLALVTLKDGAQVTEKELLGFAKEFISKGILAREALLLKVKFVDTIAKTSVGKVDKKELRRLHL